ncbi:hypothetical protein K1T71_003550 [Dendrolimus kikuchii]|uniref:Uncharacterized protein n=1 Tax=Dendrolimus kikuchii TaxID=765133 RepID=A0ACC1DCA2_9NEOP|nr:hypothetical protein K1T71_003550 [Dendrolimus kikuchii]
MLFYILLVLCLILLCCFLFVNKNRDYWKKRNVVQVNGTLWKFLFSGRSLSEIYKEIYEEHNESHIGFFLGANPALIIKDLEDIQAVLAGEFHSFYNRGIIQRNPSDILADNILFIDEFQKWKIIRNKFSPVFTSLRLKTMYVVIEKCAKDFVELIANDTTMNDKPFNALYTYTAASIGASVFGIETVTGKNLMESPFLDMAWKCMTPSLKLNLKFCIGNVSPKLFKWLDLKLFGEHEDFFLNAVKSVLKRRRNAEKQSDFIDLCLELQKQGTMIDPVSGYRLEPSDEIIAAQAFFFFLAGIDTTANAMHFTLLELASNPNVLSKLHDEIDAVFRNNKQELSYDDLDKMQYLDMVINEAMRKYPPIGAIQRKCTKGTVLSSKNVKVEKDTIIVIPIYALHRDESLYPDPELFDPQRFDPNEMKVQKYSFLGFGEGNRICLGARFARLQMKAGLAWLLRRFTLVEQHYKKDRFEPSAFSIRDADAKYEFIPRNV